MEGDSEQDEEQGTKMEGAKDDSDKELEAELKTLELERADILQDVDRAESKLFRDLECQVKLRMKNAGGHRDLQLQNCHGHFRTDVQQARNEFTRGKRRLQSGMLDMAAERRRRLDALRLSGATKRRRRTRAFERARVRALERGRARGVVGASKAEPFVNGLERQGLVRVALTPDEVNADLEQILRGMDSVRMNGSAATLLQMGGDAATATAVAAAAAAAATAGGKGADSNKVHSSRGILHYHDATFEKGDRVAVLHNARPKPTARFAGTVVSVNAKELCIRGDDGVAQHRVFVAHLCSGRYLLKAA